MGQCTTRCPKCGRAAQVDSKFIGKGLQCKGCGQVFQITEGTGKPAAGKPRKPAAAQSPPAVQSAAAVEGQAKSGPPPEPPPARPAEKRIACPQCAAVVHVDTSIQGRVFYCARCKGQVYPLKPGGPGAENQFYWECRKCAHAILVEAKRHGALEAACDKCGHVNFIPETRVNPAFDAWTAAEKQRERGAKSTKKT
jgi:DNA-directed RNA polymerase subunit M/transcription elongation factor TFIIS